jgi:hypothetical protein
MLDLTAQAEVNGMKFDGVDLFLYDPHVSHRHRRIDGIKALADKIRRRGLWWGRWWRRCGSTARRWAMKRSAPTG